MSESPRLTPARRAAQAARDERLAHALRDNLRRRKEQARAKQRGACDPPTEPPARDEPPA